MYIVKLTKQEKENLVVFLTGERRLQLTGNEAFEFTNIVGKIVNSEEETKEESKEVKEVDMEG